MVVRRALGISGISQAITFVLGFANVVIVSRLLKPEEIGVFSVAVSVLGLAHIFREFGVGQYLVQASKVSHQQFRASFTVALMTSWAVAALLFVGRWPMARLYEHDGIAEILLLLAVNFMILPLGTPSLSMLKRDLQFAKHAWVTIVGAVVQTGVTIGAAMAGESYLSMAWGSLAMTVSKMIVVNMLRPGETFILPTFKGLREVVRFGSASSMASIVKEVGGSAPDLIFGRTLGFVEVAFFSRGVGLYRMVVERINALVRNVFFPTFAVDLREGGDPAALYGRATNYLLSVTGPTLAVLAVLSQPLILFVFGHQWARSVPIASLVCAGSILTAPFALYGLALIAAGKVSVYLWTEIASQTARVLVLLTSVWLTLEQVVVALLLAYLLEAGFSQYALHRAFGLSLRELFRQVWRALALIPFAASGPGLIVWASGQPMFDAAPHLLVLMVSSALAVTGWVVGVFIVQHPMRLEVTRLAGRFRPRGA